MNEVVEDSLRAWQLPERVQRLALPSFLYHRSDLEHMTMRLAESPDGTLCGVAALEPAGLVEVRRGGDWMLLHGLYVEPSCQGCGVGTALLDRCMQAARVAGCRGLVARAWREAETFFLERGFEAGSPAVGRDEHPRRLWRPVR